MDLLKDWSLQHLSDYEWYLDYPHDCTLEFEFHFKEKFDEGLEKTQSTDLSMKGWIEKKGKNEKRKRNLLPKVREPRDPLPPPTFSSQIVVEPSPSAHHLRKKLKTVTKDDSLDIFPPT